jgi:hypothetical protein
MRIYWRSGIHDKLELSIVTHYLVRVESGDSSFILTCKLDSNISFMSFLHFPIGINATYDYVELDR